MSVDIGLVVPGLPHPLLCPGDNPGWQRLRDAFDGAAARLRELDPDVLLVYSTMWPSIIGHQLQAHPTPTWVHVDEVFHHLGSIPYSFRSDVAFADGWNEAAHARGLPCRTVAYDAFPVDTGSVVALKLLDPDDRFQSVICSSNVYADRAETIVMAKAARDALAAQGKRAAAIVVMTLSNRLFTDWIDPADDRIHSAKDDEWNLKLLELLGEGRLEDTAQLSRTIHKQIRVHKVVNFKPMWFLSALMGAHNRYDGHVGAYEPVHGTGCAVVTLEPSASGVGDKEFDEDDVESWQGDRDVLERGGAAASEPEPAAEPATIPDAGRIDAPSAPKPVGAYPHARRVGDLLFLSGVGPRQPGTDAVPGGPIRDDQGRAEPYDIRAQTRAVIDNVRTILEASGASLDDVVDVTAFLVDMDADFEGYNEVYAEAFGAIGPTRTTLAVRALPTPIAVELKVIARPRT